MGALLEVSDAIWRRFLAKLERRWAQDGRKMGQVGSKLRPRWAMMAPRWPSWSSLGAFGGSWEHFWLLFLRSLEKLPKCKNDQLYSTFATILGVGASSGGSWRLPWEGFGRYVGRLWLQDGVFLAILGDVWTSWRQGWRTRAQDAADDRKSKNFGSLEGGRDRCSSCDFSRVPLRNSKGRGWSSHLHLELPTPPGNS